MQSCTKPLMACCLVLAWPGSMGCVEDGLSWKAMTGSGRDAGRMPDRDLPGPSRVLRLFGDVGTESEISFEGGAAVDFQQHTFPNEGSDFDPGLSPDGTTIAFSSTRHSENSHLYLKRVNGSAVTQLTSGRGSDVQPTFDPSGRRIAFASSRAGNWDIWLIDIDGRNVIQVTDSPMPELHPTWAPDGNRLAYCRMNQAENRSELWVVELEASGVRRWIGDGMFPAWSPKGNRIAYQRARERGSRWFSVWMMEYENGEPRLPTEIASNASLAMIAPSWSPDGRQLAFAAVAPDRDRPKKDDEDAQTSSRRARVAIVDADGRGLQYLTDSDGENYSPVWGADGRIYYTARIGSVESIWSVRSFRPPLGDLPTWSVESVGLQDPGPLQIEEP